MPISVAQAYERFVAAGQEARASIEASAPFREYPDTRDGAYHVLAEATAMAYSWAMATRLDAPRILHHHCWHLNVFSVGPNCQDHRYGILSLDGGRRYRLRGRLGAQKLTLVQVQNHMFGHPDSKEIGQYDLANHADDDGTFDVPIGADVEDRKGIRLDPSSRLNFAIFRRIFGTISDDPGDIWVERETDFDADPDHDRDIIVERFARAGDLLKHFVEQWSVGLYELYIQKAAGKNALWYVPGQALDDGLIGSSFTSYGLAIYSLLPDEALIISWDPPDSAYWSFQACDVWARSLDFANFQTDVNDVAANLDADGRFRGVVSAVDPGVPNWLDNRGNHEGQLLMRNYLAKTDTGAPVLTKVPLAELRDHLPADTPVVTPEQRRETLSRRRTNYRIAYGD